MGAVAAITALAGLGFGVYQGQKSGQEQRRAVRRQEQAQRESTAAAAAQQRRAEMESRKANRKQPDVTSLLAEEQRGAMQGPASTILTGATGATRRPGRIGGPTSLLGG